MAFVPFAPLDDNLSDAGDLVSVEAFQAIADNCNYLIDSMPIGSIIPVMVGLTNCPTPDPRLWQECNNTIILNQDSELRNNPTPNYLSGGGRYMRGYVSIGTVGNFGGSNTDSFNHNHGGMTGIFEQPDDNSDTDEEFITTFGHAHGISNDLSGLVNIEPRHVRLKHFIKIA